MVRCPQMFGHIVYLKIVRLANREIIYMLIPTIFMFLLSNAVHAILFVICIVSFYVSLYRVLLVLLDLWDLLDLLDCLYVFSKKNKHSVCIRSNPLNLMYLYMNVCVCVSHVGPPWPERSKRIISKLFSQLSHVNKILSCCFFNCICLSLSLQGQTGPKGETGVPGPPGPPVSISTSEKNYLFGTVYCKHKHSSF